MTKGRLMRIPIGSIFLLTVLSSALPAAPAGLHDRIVGEYLSGTWDQAETDLASVLPTTPEKADLDYIRKTITECRPAWWKLCKAGKKVSFRAVVWGQQFGTTYNPEQEKAMMLNFDNGRASVAIKWNAAEMDDPAEAEHGFTKGELNDLEIWEILGTSASWTMIPVDSMVNLDDSGNKLLTRYLDFRGDVTALYYATPRARRWSIWLNVAAWNGEYARMTTVNSRKAVGAMVMQEIVGHREKYPSVQLPDSLPADRPEAALAEHLRHWIEKHPLTLAEDQSLREAIKAFSLANALSVRKNGSVKLPSGLLVTLEPKDDAANETARQKWILDQMKKK